MTTRVGRSTYRTGCLVRNPIMTEIAFKRSERNALTIRKVEYSNGAHLTDSYILTYYID